MPEVPYAPADRKVMDMQKKGNKTMMIYILFVLYIAA